AAQAKPRGRGRKFAGGQRIRFASPPATPKRSRCPRELSKRRILARLRTDRKPKRESARRRWTGRYRLLLKRSFAARCSSGLRTMTLEIALRSLALLSFALEDFFRPLTAACKSLLALMIARMPFLSFSALASESFGPLLPILTPPRKIH